ncbi:hypothetical protein Ddc_02099 [Ditylenchus destructor]|nr:hypothetical protein Ddc_02099 [Ditylenchus destructor]
MRLHTVAPPPLPRQYQSVALQHHRVSEGQLTRPFPQHRTSEGALLGAPVGNSNSTRLSLDTKDEYYLLRRTSQFEGKSGSIWVSYLSIFIAILLTLSIVFGVGYYINLMSAKHTSDQLREAFAQSSAERIFGSRFFEADSAGNGIENSSTGVVDRIRSMVMPRNASPPTLKSEQAELVEQPSREELNSVTIAADIMNESGNARPRKSFIEFVATAHELRNF